MPVIAWMKLTVDFEAMHSLFTLCVTLSVFLSVQVMSKLMSKFLLTLFLNTVSSWLSFRNSRNHDEFSFVSSARDHDSHESRYIFIKSIPDDNEGLSVHESNRRTFRSIMQISHDICCQYLFRSDLIHKSWLSFIRSMTRTCLWGTLVSRSLHGLR